MSDATPLANHAQPSGTRRSGTQALTPSTSIRTQLGPLLAFLGVFAGGIYAVARIEGRIDAIQVGRIEEATAMDQLRGEVHAMRDALIYSHVLSPGGSTGKASQPLPSSVVP